VQTQYLLILLNSFGERFAVWLAGAYFCINMILITLSTFLAVIVINTHIRGDRRNTVPGWLRRVSPPPLSLSHSQLANLTTYSAYTI